MQIDIRVFVTGSFARLAGIILFLLQFGVVSAQPVTASWDLTVNPAVSNTGHIAGSSQSSNGIGVNTYTADGVSSDNWETGSVQNTNKYYEFSISPTPGYNLTITDLSIDNNTDGVSGTALIQYSYSAAFSSPANLGAGFPVSTGSSVTTSFSSLSIPVNNGQTLYVRVFAWDIENASKVFNARNLVLSGMSVPCNPDVDDFDMTIASPVCSGTDGTVSITDDHLASGSYTITYDLSGANTATGLTASMTFTAGSPGAGSFIVPAASLINAGTTTVTVTSIENSFGCSSNVTINNAKNLVVTALPVATFNYTGSPYCSNSANPLPAFSGGGVAGVFSSTAGLVFVNTATGEVDMAASTPGTYVVTNTIAPSGGCAQVTATANITITSFPVATFSYTGSPFCTNGANPLPAFSGGGVAGVFSSSAGLSFVNTATGEINLSASTAGTYTVTNTIAAAGGCPLVSATSGVTIRLAPTATIAGTTNVCLNGASPLVAFTNPQTSAVTITYNINGGANATINVAASASATVSAPTSAAGTFSYNLVGVVYQSAPGCSNNISGTATVTVRDLPTVAIGGTATVCQGGSGPAITFTNSLPVNVLVTYKINGGSNLLITVPANGSNSVTAPTGTAGTFVYSLFNAQYSGSPTCPNPGISGSATVTVNPTPTVSISGTTSVCQNAVSPNVTFTNPMTLPVTITYNINGGSNATINVAGSSSATVAAATATAGVFNYNLVNVAYQSAPACTNTITGTATVTVNAQPSANITGSATFCTGTSTTLGSNALAGSGTISSYQWLLDGSPIGGATAATYAATAAGTYTVTVTNSNGCTFTSGGFVTSTLPLPAVPNTPVGASRCGTGTLSISATAGAGETIDWYAAPSGGAVLAGGTGVTSFTTPSISSTTTYYAQARNTTTGCISATRLAVTATVNPLPSAPAAGNNARCGTGVVVISATPGAGETIDWYAAASGGSVLAGGTGTTSFTTPSIAVTTTYFAQARNTTTGCIAATRTAVVATINSIPAAATGAVNGSTCGTGTVNISAANPGAGLTLDWYAASSGGTVLAGGTGVLTFTTPSISSTTVFYAEVRNSSTGCVSATRLAVTATVNTTPGSPTGPVNGTRCGTGTVALSVANPGAGFTIDWYAASSGGSVLAGGTGVTSFTTPSISATTIYYAVIRNTSTGCISTTRTAVTATVNPLPAAPSGSGSSRCGTGTVTISATAGAGETIDWYAAASGGTVLAGGTGTTSYTTPSLSNTTTYYAQARNITTGCVSATRTAVAATVTAIPSPQITFTQGQHDVAFSITACGTIDPGNQNDLDIFTGDPGGAATYQWQVSTDNGATWFNGPGPTATTTQYVLDPVYMNYETVAGTYKFRLIITDNGCAGTSDVITLTVTGVSDLVAGTVGSNQSFCGSGDPAAFTVLTSPTGGTGTYTYQWQSSIDNVNFSNIAGATAATYNAPLISQTTYYRRITVSAGCQGISNTITVSVSAASPATPGTISGTNPVCPASTGNIFSIAAVAGAVTYNWTVPAGWTITAGAGTTSITVTAGGSGSSGNISVTATNGCGTSAASTLAVSAVAITTSNAGPDQTGAATCGLTTVTLAGNTPVSGTGSWSIISGAGGSFGNSASATSSFSGTAGTTYTLRWTITNGSCTSTDDVIITFNRNPTTSNAGADRTDITTCGVTTLALAANTPTIGTGAWSIVSGTGGSFSNTASPTSNFTGTAGNTYTLRWTISNSPCAASTDDVVVTLNRNPTTANAGPDQTGASTCGATSVTLAGNTPTVGTGAWSIISGTGGSITTPSSPTSTFTGVNGNTYTLRWTISNAPCNASTDDVIITFNVPPTTSNAGPDQTSAATCGLTSVTLAANTPSLGTGAWSIISGAGGSFSNTTNPAATFNGTAGTTYTLRWTITNGSCTSTDDVIVTFNRNPTTANAGVDKTNCNSGSFTMTGNTPTVGTGAWTLISGTATITTASSPTSGITGVPAGTSATLRWTISNNPCTASFDDVVLTNMAASTVPNAGANQTQCNNGNFTLAGNNIINGTGSWSVVSGTASITTPSSPTSGVTGVPAGTSATLRWTNTNSPCATLTDDVILTNNQSPVTTGVSICIGGAGSLTSSAACATSTTTTAGPNFAGTGATGGTGASWGSLTSISANDNTNVFSAPTAGGSTQSLNATNFGFSIPGTATIVGVQVIVGRLASVNSAIRDNTVRLLVAGVASGNNYASTGTFWTTTETALTYGATNDSWGLTLTPAQVNATNFGATLKADNTSGSTRTAWYDYVQISVTYTIPGTMSWYTVSSGGTSIGNNSPFNPVGVAGSGLANTNTAGTTVYYAECASVPGCRTATNFVINPTPTLTGATQASTVCINGPATINLTGLNASSTNTINYTINGVAQTPVSGVTANASGNASFNTIALSPANNGQALVITSINNGTCSQSFSQSLTLAVYPVNTWLGVNTNWFDTQNWCTGVVPTSSTDVLIPNGAANYPIINTGTASAKNVTIQNASAVIVNGAKLQIAGSITNSGTFNASAGTIELNGSSGAQSISGGAFAARTLGGLTISNASGVNVSSVANDTLNIADSLSFGNVNNAVLNTGNNITLLSRAAKTARVADITNGGANTGNSFAGKMIVERYIPQRRAWRMMNVPVQQSGSQTFNAAWQEGAVNPNYVYANRVDPHPGYGMLITGPTVGAGFDPSPLNNPSVQQFNPLTSTWTGIPNTLTAKVTDSAGYMVFIRGDRGTQIYLNTAAPTSNTILRTSGSLKTNGQTTTVPAGIGAYSVVGNPYASSIDLRKISTTGSVSGINYVVWDPALTGTNGVGAYQYLTRSGGPGTDYLVFPGNSAAGGGSYGAAFSVNNDIQSGQAFLVQNAGAGSVIINENAKIAPNTSVVFRPSSNPLQFGYISTLLMYENGSQDSLQLVDGALMMYDENYDDAIDLEDAKKMLNFSSENFGISSNGQWLQIEKRKRVGAGDTIFFKARSYRVRDYQLKIEAANIDNTDLSAYLEDNYLHTSVPVSINGTTVYRFRVTVDSGAWHPDRFRIVFKQNVVLPVTITSVKAYRNNRNINVEWKTDHELSIAAYEVEKSADGIHFAKIYTESNVTNNDRGAAYQFTDNNPVKGVNFYRIKSREQNGAVKYTQVVKVIFEPVKAYVTLYPNPVTDATFNLYFVNEVAGEYKVRLLNNAGQLIESVKIIHRQSSTVEVFQPQQKLQHGNYILDITKPGGEKQTISVLY